MLVTQAAECESTGRLLTGACQMLSAGNTVQGAGAGGPAMTGGSGVKIAQARQDWLW